MKLTNAMLALLLAFFSVASTAGAATIRVPQDQPTIRLAIELARPGDRIVIAPGTYDGNIRMTSLNGITLEGNKNNRTVIFGSFADGIRLTDCSDITLRNLTLRNMADNGITTDRCQAIRIERCVIEEVGFRGIQVAHGSGVLLDRNRIENCGQEGILLGARHSVARNNRIRNTRTGIAVSAPRCVVDGNVIIDPVDTGVGTVHPDATSCLFSNNRIEASDASGTGIGLTTSAPGSVVRDNSVTGFTGQGIGAAADHCMLLDNAIADCGSIGVHVIGKGAVLAGNRIERGDGHGLEPGGGAPGGRSLIVANRIRDAGNSGIFVNTSSNTFLGNSVAGSDVLDLLDVGSHNVFHGNEFGTRN